MIFLWFATRLGVESKRFASVVLQGFLYEGGVCHVMIYGCTVQANSISGIATP